MGSRTRRAALAASLVLLATILPAGVSAGPGSPPVSPALCDARPNDNFKKLLECVTVEGVREHQAALQEIANENGGTRVSGTAGYDESVDYAVDVLEARGYAVTVQEFAFVRFEVLSPSVLEQTARRTGRHARLGAPPAPSDTRTDGAAAAKDRRAIRVLGCGRLVCWTCSDLLRRATRNWSSLFARV